MIQPGATTRLVVTFKKEGRYPYSCTVPEHANAGMRAVLTVRCERDTSPDEREAAAGA